VQLLVRALVGALPWLAVCCPALGAGAGRPNIILILADDFGYECVGANGGQSYRTPHLDRLAAAGMRFERCHVQPMCTPTRVELLTGLSNVRNYYAFDILLRDQVTVAHRLRDAGYATGVCGKWQLGREPDSPRHFGFDEALLWQHTRRPPRYANPGLERDGVERDWRSGEYGPDLVNDFALDFITRHQDGPFFLFYPLMLTHEPFQPTPDSPEWDATAVGENVNRDVRHFGAMVEYMDKLVGRLEARLAELGIRDDTLLVFLGDNGTAGRVTSRFQGADFRGGKAETTHRGTHVPLIVSWPAVVRGGRVNGDLIAAVDLLPTLCAAADVDVPGACDGVSFLPQLQGRPAAPRPWIYAWYSPRRRHDPTVWEYAFDEHYKLYRDGRFYDLTSDPEEAVALPVAGRSGAAAAAAARLQGVLQRFANARPERLDREFEAAGRAAGAAPPRNP
jgi:arylsulfatase A